LCVPFSVLLTYFKVFGEGSPHVKRVAWVGEVRAEKTTYSKTAVNNKYLRITIFMNTLRWRFLVSEDRLKNATHISKTDD
jgi:hypothetical protein